MSCSSDGGPTEIQDLVNTVVVNLGLSKLTVGQTIQAAAIAKNVSGGTLSGVTINWSSSDNAVATVAPTGLVTAVGPGEADIAATAAGQTATATVTVTTVPVASVAVSLSASIVSVGQTVTATATTRDGASAVLSGRSIYWSSSNTAVATIDTLTGSITPVGIGTTDIIAASEGVTGQATLTVQAPDPGSVTVSLGSTLLEPGMTTTASAVVRDAASAIIANPSIDWSSSNASVATVSAGGLVTAVAPGSVTIRATSNGVTGSAPLVVQAAVASISIAFVDNPLSAGRSTTATATLRDGSGNIVTGRGVTWVSSNTGVATISATGNVTAVSVGITTITATEIPLAGASSASAGTKSSSSTAVGASGSASLTVQVPAASIGVGLGATSVRVGNTTTASASVFDAGGNLLNGRPVVWRSSNPSIASVTSAGIVLGVATGDASITATADGVTGAAGITIVAASGGTGSPGATQLAITTQPGGAISGAVFGTPPVVELRDANGATVTTANNLVTATVTSGSGSVVVGTNAALAVNGVATFSGLRIVGTGPHTLTFTVAGLPPVASSSFTIAAATPAQLAITTQPSASAQSGTAFAQQPVVQLQDASANAVAQGGVAITAAISSGSGTLGGTVTATTNASGVATFGNLSITGAGSHTLTFTSGSLTAATSSSITVGASAATKLAITTQPSASVQSGVALAQQPAIQLRDASNNAVSQSGVVVTAAIASGSGTLGGTATATTNASGLATFANLSITGSGAHTLTFTASGLTAATSSTITVGGAGAAATKLSISTQPSSSVVSGSAFAQQPVIQLLDASNNAVGQSGVVVTATIASGGGTLGGTTTATTNASGVATFTNLSISGTIGAQTLTFAATGLTSVTSATITLSGGLSSKLSITTQPSSAAQVGVAFAQQPVIQLQDGSSNPVSQAGVVVTAAIATGGGTLGGTTTATTNASGVATFAGLSITGSTGARTLSFTSTGLTSATSATVTVSAGPATKLTITTQPSATATSGVAFATQPVVQLRDAGNNAVAQGGVSVTVAIATGGGTLGGTATVSTSASGAAAFSGLSISGTNGARTLSFSASGLTGITSSTITVSAPATQLTITTQPSAAATSGVTFAQQPVIQLRDASNAAVSQSGVVVTAAIASGGGTLNGTTTATTNASGVATFTSLSISGTAGSRTLRFTSGTLTAATSTAINVTVATSDEPVFNASVNTMVYQDNMDSYTDVVSMGAVSPSTPRIVPRPSPVTTSQSVDASAMMLTTGRTGKAIRMFYDGSVQNGPTFLTWNMPSTPDLATHYFSYYARVTASSPLTNHLAHKWFLAYHRHADAGRAEWDTHDHLPCTVDSHDTYWHFYDNGKETTCQGQQPIGPYFNENIANGQWHRFTYTYRPNTSPGSRDGFARMWIDGVKMMDVSASAVGVTPPGGEKPWCNWDDVDAILANDGIVNQFWGSVQTSYTSPSWTLDIDDYSWWIKP